MININMNFISQNIAPKGTKKIVIYDSNDNEIGVIPLGNLSPNFLGDKLYSFGALSDVHLPYETGKDDFIRAVTYFNEIEKVNFICISGDMSSSGTVAEWADYKTHVDTYSPNTIIHISAGNHDTTTQITYDYPIKYTGNPLYYSFTQDNDVFIMFGMTLWGSTPFSNESLQWLYETLEENRNKRCFVFQHMMRKNYSGDASGKYGWDGLNNTNGKVFLSLMEHYKNVLWFHGHSHCEFEHQDTLALPNSNYDRAFGCHSIHVPSCCATRNEDNGYDYEDSEGYVVDVYENGVHLRGRDFMAEKFLPIASYWIDTTLEEIEADTYLDSTNTILTGEHDVIGITVTKTITSYDTGEKLNINDIVVKANYNDTAGVVVTDYTVDSSLVNMNEDGTYYLTITYKEYTASIAIVVSSAFIPTGNLLDSSTCTIGQRVRSAGAITDQTSTFLTDYIEIGKCMSKGSTNVLHWQGFHLYKISSDELAEVDLTALPDTGYRGVAYYDALGNYLGQSSLYSTEKSYDSEGNYCFTLNGIYSGATKIRVWGITLPIATSIDDLQDCKITLNQLISEIEE